MSDADTIPVRADLTPHVSPRASTVAVGRDLADQLSMTATPLVGSLASYTESMIAALRTGDFAAFIIGLSAIETTSTKLVEAFNGFDPINRMMSKLDPEYFDALAPARREFEIIRAIRVHMAPLTNAELRETAEIHRRVCPGGEACATHEALSRALHERGIRG